MNTPIGLPARATTTALAPVGQIGEDAVDLLVSVDRRERRVHRRGDVLVERIDF